MCEKRIFRNKENMEELSSNIKKLRLLADMTQEELADQVGVVRQTIAYLERGEYMPSLALAWRLAKVFNKSVEEVFDLK
ncbi:MAG TPA: helix-turn-helix transcriptional regulator [Patescibacteria group bacterium]|nr:helix-turn-helix transcriptional regulator [Patescibacteria group bacterium]